MKPKNTDHEAPRPPRPGTEDGEGAACCAPKEQKVCCAPSEKVACCGATASPGSSCGCR
jgi:hypothetical protein